jgi:allophanate hydrolase
MSITSLSINNLHAEYKNKTLDPETLVSDILTKAITFQDHNIWIYLLSMDEIQPYLDQLSSKSIEDSPLWGIPFAIKDNIDLAGIPTTAGCPNFVYTPKRSAFVVDQLIEAGAIPIGKTNLDQFATGLVGTRSPYGACKNSINPEMISGGSSSGSAVSVGLDLVSFSLGTDTAGSGRVPAFLNNLIGVKPTLGCLSASGLIPACRTLDTISIFSKSIEDAQSVFDVTAVYDENDDYAREYIDSSSTEKVKVIGAPKAEDLEWFGNSESQSLFEAAISQFESTGCQIKPIDFKPFIEAAKLLYHGPWVAERYAALEDIMENRPEILHPVTHSIVEQATKYSAVDTFKSMYKLQAYKKQADHVMSTVDSIVIPTAATYYTIDELKNDPVQLNTNLGFYTNFMNLLDYSALAIPFGHYKNTMPFGITLFAPAFKDKQLMSIAENFLH